MQICSRLTDDQPECDLPCRRTHIMVMEEQNTCRSRSSTIGCVHGHEEHHFKHKQTRQIHYSTMLCSAGDSQLARMPAPMREHPLPPRRAKARPRLDCGEQTVMQNGCQRRRMPSLVLGQCAQKHGRVVPCPCALNFSLNII